MVLFAKSMLLASLLLAVWVPTHQLRMLDSNLPKLPKRLGIRVTPSAPRQSSHKRSYAAPASEPEALRALVRAALDSGQLPSSHPPGLPAVLRGLISQLLNASHPLSHTCKPDEGVLQLLQADQAANRTK